MPRIGVHPHLAVGDDAALVLMHVLDRILDRHDVAARLLVAVADHRRERGGFARTRGPHHDHQAALGHDHVLQYVREPEVLDPGNGGGDHPQHDTDVRLLDERIDAEPPYARGVDREVAFLARFELGSLPVVHDRAGEVDGVRGCERLVRDGRHLAVDLDRRGKAHGDEEVGGSPRHHQPQQVVHEFHCLFAFHIRLSGSSSPEVSREGCGRLARRAPDFG